MSRLLKRLGISRDYNETELLATALICPIEIIDMTVYRGQRLRSIFRVLTGLENTNAKPTHYLRLGL